MVWVTTPLFEPPLQTPEGGGRQAGVEEEGERGGNPPAQAACALHARAPHADEAGFLALAAEVVSKAAGLGPGEQPEGTSLLRETGSSR